MDERITIIHRTDDNQPRIRILGRNDVRENEPDDQNVISKTVENVRTHLLRRHDSFDVIMSAAETRKYQLSLRELASELISLACSYRKPFIYNDYDYLYRSVRGITCKIMGGILGTRLCYKIDYLTTVEQEEEISSYLGRLFYEKNAYAISEPEMKVKFAYDYIISTVKYDNTHERHSAYHALIEKKAVCEGCALLFYRFMTMLSVPCRIITGKALEEGHAWNIVKIGDLWYNMDVTWDLYKNFIERGLGLYDYFLVGDDNFQDHFRDPQFAEDDFCRRFPVSRTDFRRNRVN